MRTIRFAGAALLSLSLSLLATGVAAQASDHDDEQEAEHDVQRGPVRRRAAGSESTDRPRLV